MTGVPLIDIHQHIFPDLYRSALARIGIMGSGENPWPDWSFAHMLELMDAHGIVAVVASIASPGAYFGDIEFTRRLVRDCNEHFARMVGDRPSQLGAMGFVPLPDVDAAVRDAARSSSSTRSGRPRCHPLAFRPAIPSSYSTPRVPS
jgi:hypothetical protein